MMELPRGLLRTQGDQRPDHRLAPRSAQDDGKHNREHYEYSDTHAGRGAWQSRIRQGAQEPCDACFDQVWLTDQPNAAGIPGRPLEAQ